MERCGLASFREPCGEAVGEIGVSYLLLGLFYVVGHAVEGHSLRGWLTVASRFRFVNGEGGAGVAVAWLAH